MPLLSGSVRLPQFFLAFIDPMAGVLSVNAWLRHLLVRSPVICDKSSKSIPQRSRSILLARRGGGFARQRIDHHIFCLHPGPEVRSRVAMKQPSARVVRD